MAFGKQGAAAARVAATANAASAGAGRMAAKRSEASIPNSAALRKRGLKESDEERAMRLRAKAVNFTCTLVARGVILAGAIWYVWHLYNGTGVVARGYAFGVVAMIADYGRVLSKMMAPGTK